MFIGVALYIWLQHQEGILIYCIKMQTFWDTWLTLLEERQENKCIVLVNIYIFKTKTYLTHFALVLSEAYLYSVICLL